MSQFPVHPRIRPLLDLTAGLTHLARETAKVARKTYAERTRQQRGSTLRPGPDTPLWNELVAETRALLKKYGAKANLARELGVPRQRLHQYLMERSAGPDAERTLLLLAWVNVHRRQTEVVSRNK